MEYTWEIDSHTGICTVRVDGTVRRPDDSVALQHLANEIHQEHGCGKFLFDMLSATVITNGLLTYKTVQSYAKKLLPLIGLKVAVLYPEITEEARFLETVAMNRSFRLRVFDDRETADDWLQGKAGGTGRN